MEQIENLKRIQLIANLEIPVSKNSPIFSLFLARKEACKVFGRATSEEQVKTVLEMIGYYNEAISRQLILWQ